MGSIYSLKQNASMHDVVCSDRNRLFTKSCGNFMSFGALIELLTPSKRSEDGSYAVGKVFFGKQML